MARVIYRYNPETCRYEPESKKGKRVLKQFMLFTGLSLLVAFTLFLLFLPEAESFSASSLVKENKALKTEWNILEKRIRHANQELSRFVEKDDHNYRVILDSQPLQTSIREAGVGGSERSVDAAEIKAFPMVYSDYKRIDKLKHKVDIEIQSFSEIEKLLDSKIKMWASRPAIQPIDNRQLDRLHLTFGPRFHPIFKRYMDHKGLDFSAPKGTPVYATGDGKVIRADRSSSYGNVIYVSHGHGFETRYAHLSAFNIKAGETVKRGQVIGFVGNTGNSVSSHLHYEVLYNGTQINPINFFQRDLSNKEYEKLIQLGEQNTEILD